MTKVTTRKCVRCVGCNIYKHKYDSFKGLDSNYQILHHDHHLCPECQEYYISLCSRFDTNIITCPSEGCTRHVFVPS